jgi:hypothetical protein
MARLPTASSLFQVCNRRINNRGNRKVCFMKTKTSSTTNSTNRSPLRRGFLLITLVLVCTALSPQARAVCQEGCLTLDNTVFGDDALINLTTGFSNTALGFNALFSNTIGRENTATGAKALHDNTEGYENTASGTNALSSNTEGIRNTATGAYALNSNTTGISNTSSGNFALFNNTTGNSNIAVGFQAGFNVTTGSNNIYIGNAGGSGGESNRIRIGTVGTQTATFIAGISGGTVPGGVGVIVGNNGRLGTVVSSERFKEAIKPMDKVSEAILALKPVTFRYKHELDADGIPQFGLVAEEVEEINPDLVARDADGKVYTVRYEAVNAMLLNEFLKAHHQLQDLKAIVAEQQKQIKALASGLQKVSAQVELSKPAPQTVLNNQ